MFLVPAAHVRWCRGRCSWLFAVLLKHGTSVCRTTQPTTSKHRISDRIVAWLGARRQIPPDRRVSSAERRWKRSSGHFKTPKNGCPVYYYSGMSLKLPDDIQNTKCVMRDMGIRRTRKTKGRGVSSIFLLIISEQQKRRRDNSLRHFASG
ncbi:hypothetical protein T265_01486 [Opisthorchis viverrini]|uniref:Secreted protein n=2 Tax=Opisthorchis viverrini TaxID=6198 RepID=A0A074ZZC6_OPIVI|nr:hypothetical protein T265_01486 [Opisthorchis viverrini]KER32431.1 hypothetical protein T265_01486 [Opisthorchis viverrini]